MLISDRQENVVFGKISYREKIALPPNSVIKVKLLDVSLQDIPAVEMASQTIITKGEQIPISFQLPIALKEVKPNHRYVVRAEIYIDDKLAFTTTKNYPVITQNYGYEVNLVLYKVNNSSLENQLVKTKWLLEDLAGKGVIDNVQTTLEFGLDNRLFGNGGCNGYFTSYKFNEHSFNIKAIASTFKMCPPSVMNQETKFFEALTKAKSVRLEGNFLFIEVEGFDQPLKFTRF